MFPLAAPDKAAIPIGGGVLGVEPDSLGEVGDGLVVFSLFVPRGAAVAEKTADFGIESDRVAVVVDRLVELSLQVPCDATCEIEVRIPLVELDGPAQVGYGLVVLMLISPRNPAFP